ncbi:hypothetical protein SAMD00019534_018650 [Acytostelium subglobosum LB1]|uniref:hypothetical protein n=1 Tax=Acytostelium subglobosum LB1 TaxID=1410327 RepID=UPI000644D765|nr:hypothetical protein SAMD00019534_018650 [Acytostelium subglobosum LB1]GAM18690.1 hypothetical protein SAMD00019534_018650 [Acytostelium subglobosum LB1]|eukprot:XP_012757910.1 hypothetical protein SAMD00019534_018650 [Acytostelium subglobosum LB1]
MSNHSFKSISSKDDDDKEEQVHHARLEEIEEYDGDINNNNNNNNNDDNEVGIILEPINRDPDNRPEQLYSPEEEIKDGDELLTKLTKTTSKVVKYLNNAIKERNKRLEEKFKESEIEETIVKGLEHVHSKTVGAVYDVHRERQEKMEEEKRIIWEQDKQHVNKFECLDYITIYNKAYRNEMYKNFNKLGSNYEWLRWIMSFFMGVIIGVVAYLAHLGISNISYYKFKFVKELLESDYWIAFLAYFTCNVALALLGSFLAVYYDPYAAGSGIPEVKGYLNGTRIPHVLRFKTLWTKLVSMIFAVSANLQVGSEGPMIHMGAIVGNGFSQAQSKVFGFKVPLLQQFRNDKDKRDFVTMGAGAGVAAAFKAPLGGALFSLEEVSSFWSTSLTWRSFFACLVATFTASVLKDFGLTPEPAKLLGAVIDTSGRRYELLELIPFIIIGVIGGFAGALFTYINVKVVAMRRKYINKIKSLRVLEVFFIIGLSSILQFVLPLMFPCQPIDSLIVDGYKLNTTIIEGASESLKRFTCEEGYYNPLASIMFASNDQAIDNLLVHNTTFYNFTNSVGIVALLVFFLFYFVFAAYTAGCGISSGTFVPMIVIGAAYGRLVGLIMHMVVKNHEVDPGVFALMGAAAFMAGVSRLTISLSVILIEMTSEQQYILQLMVTVMIAKWVSDALIHPLFDLLIDMKYIPYLEPHASKAMKILMCKHIMAKKPVYLLEKETLGHILEVLEKTTHNGFPVVNNHEDRCVKGLILRSQLLMILEAMSQVYISNNEEVYSHSDYTTKLTWTLPELKDFNFTKEDHPAQVDLTNVMNLTVITVNEEFAVSAAFQQFRSIGLRHMPVVNSYNRLKGIITKKDLLEKTCEQKYLELSHKKLDVDKLIRDGDDDDASQPLNHSNNARLRPNSQVANH